MHGTHGGHEPFHGRSSRLYDFGARTVLRRVYKRLARDIAPGAPRGAAVLDVGTGPGVLLVELARLRPDLTLTGVDLSPDMIAAAQRNLAPFGDRAGARVGDVTALPFPDKSFDLVVSSLSLHHWEAPEAAAPELMRVLRPGGRVSIYDFPFAPFEKLGPSRQRSRVRTGIPFVRCEKVELVG